MTEGARIAELYRSVYEGDEHGEAWHGRALKPLLKDVTPEQASREPKVGSHSILQLVLHLAYWEEVVLRRFNGEVVEAPLNTPDDWPQNRAVSATEWRAVLDRLERSHVSLRNAMAECSDEKLTAKVRNRTHNNYTLLHGMINHCVYHSGQIALVKSTLR
jgi:uncharacterized damage-inducible protein DinB